MAKKAASGFPKAALTSVCLSFSTFFQQRGHLSFKSQFRHTFRNQQKQSAGPLLLLRPQLSDIPLFFWYRHCSAGACPYILPIEYVHRSAWQQSQDKICHWKSAARRNPPACPHSSPTSSHQDEDQWPGHNEIPRRRPSDHAVCHSNAFRTGMPRRKEGHSRHSRIEEKKSPH